MFCIIDASTVLKRNRAGFVTSDKTESSSDKNIIYRPKYYLSLDGYASLCNTVLHRYKISIQKLLSIAKKHSLVKCKERMQVVGNTYIIGHDDIEVLTPTMDELNSIILLNDLRQE